MKKEEAEKEVKDLIQNGPGFYCPLHLTKCEPRCLCSVEPRIALIGVEEYATRGYTCNNGMFGEG